MNRKHLSRIFSLLLGLCICAFALHNISFTTIKSAFKAISIEVLLVFLSGILLGIILRAERYYLLLSIHARDHQNSTLNKLSVTDLRILSIKATAARNVGMGLLPARLGELVFIGIMKKGGVQISSGLGAVGLAWIFDASALLILLASLMLLVPKNQIPDYIYFYPLSYLALVMGLLMLSTIFIIPIIAPRIAKYSRNFGNKINSRKGPLATLVTLINRTIKKLEPIQAQLLAIKKTKKIFAIFFLSLLLRITKYSVLSMLLLEILPITPDGSLLTASWKLLLCFISAEGSTGIPGANFMGFGGYELAFSIIYEILFKQSQEIISHVFTVHLLGQTAEATIVLLLFACIYLVKKDNSKVKTTNNLPNYNVLGD